jgi:hypothetical protein
VSESRKLSQAISEGDGISVLVVVRDAASARAAAEQGAKGLVALVPADLGTVDLPVLAYGPGPAEAAQVAADAVVVVAMEDDHDLEHLEEAYALGLECVVKVGAEDDLERVLERLDPEILLLTADGDDDGSHLEHLLELLPDIPAGKLVIADLAGADRSAIEELERAGVDAVVVTAHDVESLVGDAVPDV